MSENEKLKDSLDRTNKMLEVFNKQLQEAWKEISYLETTHSISLIDGIRAIKAENANLKAELEAKQ